MSTYIPYTYLIGWSKLNLWYYGVEFGWRSKTANPANLWTTYFTSSNKVKHIREEYGEPDVIQIRKTFKNATSAKRWEETVLRRMKVDKDKKWINIFANTFNGIIDVDYAKAVKNWKKSYNKEKMSEIALKLWEDEDHRKKMLTFRQSPERKEYVSNQMKEVRKNDEIKYCDCCNKYIKGKGNWTNHINGISHKRKLQNEKTFNSFICNTIDIM